MKKSKVAAVILWSLVNRQHHPLAERSIKAIQPVVDSLFPGINYSPSTIDQVIGLTEMACSKLFPELAGEPSLVREGQELEVGEFLPSKGFQWQDEKWKKKFSALVG